METKETMTLLSLLLSVFTVSTSAEEWKVNVVKELDALVKSCVVIPCSFTHPYGNLPSSKLKGNWHLSNKQDHRIYDEDIDEVIEKFKGRTKLLGHLGQNNCTLEIVKVKDYDNGPFCLQIGIFQEEAQTTPNTTHFFVDNCVRFKILPNPPKPTVTGAKVAAEDQPYTTTCSVTHTCPSQRPNLTWSRGEDGKINELHRELPFGNWEVLSILTFTPKEQDDHSEVTCTAHFKGGERSSATVTVYLKRKESYSYIIIPAVVGTITAVILGAAFFVILKKYRKRISELQNQDGSVWNRLSRLSNRIRSVRSQSSWSQQRTSDKIRKSSNQKISKPRFPSPERQRSQQTSFNYKEDPDGDDYINTADLQIYGNL
ncbi:myelin-associated glycoprotein [Takifugu flavidus]|uniref:myelin-associated glycoprotein n=1 Tax=Takifugu flavidus TaxID=433684 RepID=UPI002544AB34|nr:myelin-associated glycoprotein [Takifugu flavidus]